MHFLRSWLEDYIELTGISDKQLVDTITAKSSEVEEVIQLDDYFDSKVVIGKIINVRSHPNADKLKIFDVVIDNTKSVQIVSAAPNVLEGMIVVVALEGAKLPGGIITKRAMRGEDSLGMCLGKSEMLLEIGYSSGLMEVEVEYARNNNLSLESARSHLLNNLGVSVCTIFREYFPLETIFDIKVLPNRISQIGNYRGMALEIAICLGRKDLLKSEMKKYVEPELFRTELEKKLLNKIHHHNDIHFDFDDKTGYTKHFVLCEILRNEDESYIPSINIQRRLFLTGINMAGGLVDLSNYILFDLGQPSHLFSKEKLFNEMNSSILNWKIEFSHGETSFNGLGQLKQITLNQNIPVLKNHSDTVLSIPGISGSESTKIDKDDKNIFLEIAQFDSNKVANSSFALKYRSDASKVWSGGVSPWLILAALEAYMNELTDDSVYRLLGVWSSKTGMIQLSPWIKNLEEPVIPIEYDYISKRLDGRGVEFWKDEIDRNLNLIGKVNNGNFYPNPFYSNLVTQEDLLEEVVRLVGFDKLQRQGINSNIITHIDKAFDSTYYLKSVVASYGFDEIITRPFVSKNDLLFDTNEALQIMKSYRSDQPYLRDSLAPSLLISASNNLKRGVKQPCLYEYNPIYFEKNGELIEEKFLDCIAITNDPYKLTSMILDIFKRIDDKMPIIREIKETMFGSGYLYSVEDQPVIVSLYEVKNQIKKQYDIPLSKKIWYASCDLTHWDKKINTYQTYKDESEFPSVHRSYSYEVDKDIQYKDIRKTLLQTHIQDAYIAIRPRERIHHDNHDIVNVDVEFVSYIKTLAGEEILSWEERVNLALSELGNVKTR